MKRYKIKGRAIYDTKTINGKIVDTRYDKESKDVLTPCFSFNGFNFHEFVNPLVNLLNEQDNKIVKLQNQQFKQSQNQFAVEELRDILKYFTYSNMYFDKTLQQYCLSNKDEQFVKHIKDRIRKLGGKVK